MEIQKEKIAQWVEKIDSIFLLLIFSSLAE